MEQTELATADVLCSAIKTRQDRIEDRWVKTIEDIWDQGRDLTELNELTPHGQWSKVLEELGVSSTAWLKYQKVYKNMTKGEAIARGSLNKCLTAMEDQIRPGANLPKDEDDQIRPGANLEDDEEYDPLDDAVPVGGDVETDDRPADVPEPNVQVEDPRPKNKWKEEALKARADLEDTERWRVQEREELELQLREKEQDIVALKSESTNSSSVKLADQLSHAREETSQARAARASADRHLADANETIARITTEFNTYERRTQKTIRLLKEENANITAEKADDNLLEQLADAEKTIQALRPYRWKLTKWEELVNDQAPDLIEKFRHFRVVGED